MTKRSATCEELGAPPLTGSRPAAGLRGSSYQRECLCALKREGLSRRLEARCENVIARKRAKKITGKCVVRVSRQRKKIKKTQKPRLKNPDSPILYKKTALGKKRNNSLSPPPPTQKNSPLSLPLSTAKRERAKNEKKGAAKPRA